MRFRMLGGGGDGPGISDVRLGVVHVGTPADGAVSFAVLDRFAAVAAGAAAHRGRGPRPGGEDTAGAA